MNLFHHLIVEAEDIMGLDVRRFILLEQGKLISDVQHTVENGLFRRIQGHTESWRVGHLGA